MVVAEQAAKLAEQAAKLAEREAQLGHARELVTQLRDSRSRLVAEHATETAGLKHQVVNLSDSHSALKKATVVLKMELMDATTLIGNETLKAQASATLAAERAAAAAVLKSRVAKLSDSRSALEVEHATAMAESEKLLEQARLKAAKAQLSQASSELWEEKATASDKRATDAEKAVISTNEALEACAKELSDAKDRLKTQASTTASMWKVI